MTSGFLFASGQPMDNAVQATKVQRKNEGDYPMTQRAKIYFKPSRYPSGEYWIALEALHEDLDVLAIGFLGFDLPDGTTANQAEEIAGYLNEIILAVSYTTPKSAEAVPPT